MWRQLVLAVEVYNQEVVVVVDFQEQQFRFQVMEVQLHL
jgi:hypothetical protein